MKFFYSGYSKLAERSGDLYVKRNNNCWEINAGVNSMGFSPGFGKVCDIADGSPAYEIYEEFLKKTAYVQEFIIDELGATQHVSDKIFEEIWNYIHQEVN